MHRAASLAARRLVARSRAHCGRWDQSSRAGLRDAGSGVRAPAGQGPLGAGTRLGHSSRLYCSGPDSDLSHISVVGSADPITWLRCRFLIFLIKLCFEVDLASEEFDSGAKQALVRVSHLMSEGRFHRLKGLVSDEMMEYVETRTRALTRAQREKLLVTTDDIIFLLPEDVSVVFDNYGRKFCSIVMRFWFLTTLEGPEDPEAAKIFRVAPSQEPKKKVATAVYEFHRELTDGAYPDWKVITVWHWHWTLAPETPD